MCYWLPQVSATVNFNMWKIARDSQWPQLVEHGISGRGKSLCVNAARVLMCWWRCICEMEISGNVCALNVAWADAITHHRRHQWPSGVMHSKHSVLSTVGVICIIVHFSIASICAIAYRHNYFTYRYVWVCWILLATAVANPFRNYWFVCWKVSRHTRWIFLFDSSWFFNSTYLIHRFAELNRHT